MSKFISKVAIAFGLVAVVQAKLAKKKEDPIQETGCCGSTTMNKKGEYADEYVEYYEEPQCCDPDDCCGCYAYNGCCSYCNCWQSYYPRWVWPMYESEEAQNADSRWFPFIGSNFVMHAEYEMERQREKLEHKEFKKDSKDYIFNGYADSDLKFYNNNVDQKVIDSIYNKLGDSAKWLQAACGYRLMMMYTDLDRTAFYAEQEFKLQDPKSELAAILADLKEKARDSNTGYTEAEIARSFNLAIQEFEKEAHHTDKKFHEFAIKHTCPLLYASWKNDWQGYVPGKHVSSHYYENGKALYFEESALKADHEKYAKKAYEKAKKDIKDIKEKMEKELKKEEKDQDKALLESLQAQLNTAMSLRGNMNTGN